MAIFLPSDLTQKQLENNIAKMLTDKKLLFDPIVTARFLNFRVTVLGEVNRPGVVIVPSEQISILEAIGQAGDLTIFGLRDNVILIRQEGPEKLVKRLNLNSSSFIAISLFFFKIKRCDLCRTWKGQGCQYRSYHPITAYYFQWHFSGCNYIN